MGEGCTTVLTTFLRSFFLRSFMECFYVIGFRVLLERGSIASIAERMQDYQVIAMVVLFGPKKKHIQNQVQEDVKKITSEYFIASASVFGPKGAQLRKHIDATLGSGNLREAVKLPTGDDLNEWLSINSIGQHGCSDLMRKIRV
ncbi:hypothetical protein I3760_09G217400 [Carya illinoinensis]|nr:hypothetical protein I3760_09G217400 [Carya illinoinensis]